MFSKPPKRQGRPSRPLSRHGHRRPRLYRVLCTSIQRQTKIKNNQSRLQISVWAAPMSKKQTTNQ